MIKYLTLVCVLLLALAAVACSPSGGQEVPVSGQSAADTTDIAGSALAPAGTTDTAGQTAPIAGTLATPPAPGGQVVEATPLSEDELAAQPPGQTEGGPSQEDTQSEAGDAGDEAVTSTDQLAYRDSAFGFSLSYPANFVVQAADPARLTGLIPAPDAAVYFMEPGLVESALAGTDAPNLEVRVFETGPVASLSDWLASVGVTADQTQTSTQLGTGLSGVEVCGATMIFPNCSIFVAGGARVYQLRALDQAGEAMAQSFVVTP